MDGWLKVLVAAACVVVIVGGGYFAVAEYADRKAADEARGSADSRNERLHAELLEWANASRGEITKISTYCRDMDQSLRARDDAPLTRRLVRSCRVFGYL